MARPIKVETLRRRALRILSDRLKEGNVTTADLIRITGMDSSNEAMMTTGDLVLFVRDERELIRDDDDEE
jgi:ribosomal protein L35AE/L33A